MQYVLLNISTSGLRSINKEISLKFYPFVNVSKPILKEKNIKGIYGPNGTGKSAIIASLEIYKQLCLSESFLFQNNILYNLHEAINKVNKEFAIETSFVVYYEEEKYDVFTHYINIKIENNNIVLKNETLSKLIASAKSINEKKEIIYSVDNGVFTIPLKKYRNQIIDLFIEQTKNKLDKSSIISLFIEFYNKNKLNNRDQSNDLTSYILNVYNFVNNISVFMEEKEFNRLGIDNNMIKQNKLSNQIYISDEDDVILKNEFEEYQLKINYLRNFIQIFKPNLIDIRIEKKIDKDFYICHKIFVYDNYEISASCESSGILKIMRLYNYLEDVVNGKIVFIDELDVNLHDVYLEKLLSFLAEYAKGQLCFTTHNLICMEYLKKYKNGIDFLGEDLEIVSWVKNGNANPILKYRKGMIKGSPFNVEIFDFFKAFKIED